LTIQRKPTEVSYRHDAGEKEAGEVARMVLNGQTAQLSQRSLLARQNGNEAEGKKA
jgi:hypothetical protein